MLTTNKQSPQKPSSLVSSPLLCSVKTSNHRISTIDTISVDYLIPILEKLLRHKGFILLDQQLNWIYGNCKAWQLCCAMQNSLAQPSPASSSSAETSTQRPRLPKLIKALAHSFIKNYQPSSEEQLQLHKEVCLQNKTRVHIQLEWIQLPTRSTVCILVTLQDLTAMERHRAKCDAHRYHFTSREAEVWKLHLQGLQQRQIGERLYISVNTVKRHMKNIYRKQEEG